jgi:tetratricopeptide (TPR) repeat protein
LARTPQPLVLPAHKPPNTWRIFIFGESAALGDPEPAYGFGRVLDVLLSQRHPGRAIEVVNVGITAVNSHVIRQIAKDCSPREGDLWILYIGNNEVVGPFGAGTVFGAQAASPAAVRASVLLQSSRLGQLAQRVRRYFKAKGPPAKWGGMEMFLDQQVARDDARLQKVYHSYRDNLQRIVAVGSGSGAKVLLCSIVTNLKDCAPFASQRKGDAAAVEKWVQQAASDQTSGRTNEALNALLQATQLDPGRADLQYRLGQTALAAGKADVARPALTQALDLDTLRFRADSRLQQIIQEVATESKVDLVDLAATCAEGSPDRLPGQEILYEHVHLNFEGNYLAGRALAEAAERVLAPGTTNQTWLGRDECARRLALTSYDRGRVLEEMVARLQLAPFTDQLDHTQRMVRLQKELEHWQQAAQAEGTAATEEIYRTAISARERDWVLREGHARFLQRTDQAQLAEAEWRRFIQLVPYYPPAYYGLGNTLDVEGRSADALPMFAKALQLQPGSVEALNGSGLALMNLGRSEEAAARFRNAIELRPDFTEGWVNLGLLHLRQARLPAAKTAFESALKVNPTSVAAHINLGKTLALQGDAIGAEKEYREAVRLRPDQAISHFNLANALAGRDEAGALEHYAEAVRLQPSLVEAQINLALALAKQGKTDQALAHFAKVVELRPETGEAHLNFGVALAKAGRFREAVEQFQECLRLEPTNSMAAKFLEQAKARQ